MEVKKEGNKTTWKCGKKQEKKPVKNKKKEAVESASLEVDDGRS